MNLDTDPAAAQSANPFALMVEPERVLSTMARSSQLRGLHRRRLHPLDKPLIPLTDAAAAARAAFDAQIDQEADDGLDYYLN